MSKTLSILLFSLILILMVSVSFLGLEVSKLNELYQSSVHSQRSNELVEGKWQEQVDALQALIVKHKKELDNFASLIQDLTGRVDRVANGQFLKEAMNLEKFGLLLFIKYLRQLDDVKTHLNHALRETLLACSSLLEVTDQVSQEHFLLKRFSTLRFTFTKIHQVIEFSLDQLPETVSHQTHSSNNRSKEQIIETIIGVINEEIEKIEDSNVSNRDLKIEALETVKEVLDQQIYHSELTSDDIQTIRNSR